VNRQKAQTYFEKQLNRVRGGVLSLNWGVFTYPTPGGGVSVKISLHFTII